MTEGRRLAESGDKEGAIACYRRVLGVRPDDAEAMHHLGLALAELGQVEEGLEYLRRAVSLLPDNAVWQQNLGVALAQSGRPSEAVEALRAALAARQDYPEAYYNLAGVLAGMGRRDEAIASYQKAVGLRPGYFEALNNLGLALSEAGRHEEAAPALRQAVRLRTDAAEPRNNLGLALLGMCRFAEAEEAFERSLRSDPTYADAHNNLAGLYKEQGRLDEALAEYDLALALAPHAESARYNRALALLQKGRWEEGWQEYEFRWRRKRTPERRLPFPRWDGAPLAGRTLLLWCEQGLGDAIQFVRYAEVCAERGGKVVLECPPPLAHLFATCRGIERMVVEGEPLPPFDIHAPLMSLPGILGTTPESVPARAPYLAAEPERVSAWRDRLAKGSKFLVGGRLAGQPEVRVGPLEIFPPEGAGTARGGAGGAARDPPEGHQLGASVPARRPVRRDGLRRSVGRGRAVPRHRRPRRVAGPRRDGGHLDRAPGGRAGRPGMGGAVHGLRLEVDARQGRHAVVSERPTLPARTARRLGRGVLEDGR